MQVPWYVMEKRPLSNRSGQSSRSSSTPSLTEGTPFCKRARHRTPHTPMHQGITSLPSTPAVHSPSSTKKHFTKPHRTTSHTHKRASLSQSEAEQSALLCTSEAPQPKADACLAPGDGPSHSSTSLLGRFTASSLTPIATFSSISRSFGVSGLPFTAFQLKAISVMFAARMEARLRHGDALPHKPIQLDVDDGVTDSSDSGVQDCVELAGSTCSGGEASNGAVKEMGDSEASDVHEMKRGREESEHTLQIIEKQTVDAIGCNPREVDPGKKRKERRGARPKMHPDAFVAIRISSPQIRSSLERIQSSITAAESRLSAAMVSLDKLHLTLMVLRLGEEEERMAK